MSRFDAVKFDDRTFEKSAKLKDAYEATEQLLAKLPEGRAKALALTHLEESFMWVGKALRDFQNTLAATKSMHSVAASVEPVTAAPENTPESA